MTKLERLQAASRKRNGKPAERTTAPEPFDDLDGHRLERLRRRVIAFSMMQRGIATALVAERINRAFGTRVTVQSLERWKAAGYPLFPSTNLRNLV
jgi:hypothetical protein